MFFRVSLDQNTLPGRKYAECHECRVSFVDNASISTKARRAMDTLVAKEATLLVSNSFRQSFSVQLAFRLYKLRGEVNECEELDCLLRTSTCRYFSANLPHTQKI
uniref:Uncharacterized protein n=1 Tax=Rhipicephalus microplus TaxID=6941 RepID=A0A6G5AF93_RHIMP